MFEAEKFCTDYNIAFDLTGKNTAPGWLQIQCPFCGDKHNHLGINMIKGYGNCWKCEWHPLDSIVSTILGVSKKEAKDIVKTYTSQYARDHLNKTEEIKPKVEKVEFPTGTTRITKQHKDYLESRNFDPERIERIFNIRGTGHMGNYKFRIVAPIYLNGILISYQCRDITGKATLRYKACSKDKELLHHKHTLYAVDLARDMGKKVVVTEGVVDVWRLGMGAVCPFGTSWTKKQMLMLSKYFKKVFLLFDEGDAAQEKADKLCWDLAALGLDVEIITGLIGDPGEMDQTEAKKLMRELL